MKVISAVGDQCAPRNISHIKRKSFQPDKLSDNNFSEYLFERNSALLYKFLRRRFLQKSACKVQVNNEF